MEIGYNIADCVGTGTIYGMTEYALFHAAMGLIGGMFIMWLFIVFKERQLRKQEVQKR